MGVAPPGYRLPPATRLGPVTLQVGDLARSIDYYDRVLGLGVLESSPGDTTLGTSQGEHAAGRPPRASRRRTGADARTARSVSLRDPPSQPPCARRIRAAPCETSTYAGMSDHLVSESVYLTDPDGLGIEVYADRPRDTWRQDGQQLVIGTEPLDVEDVVRAAGAERWSSMPAGATLGHVHLFVEDLGAASRFYHEGLGLDKMAWSYPGALFLAAGGYHHHLGTNTWAAGAPPAGEDDARLLEWTIRVPEPSDVGGRACESSGRRGQRRNDGDRGDRP